MTKSPPDSSANSTVLKASQNGVILYDQLQVPGGAENVTLTLAKALGNQDLCIAHRNRSHFPDSLLKEIRLFDLGVCTEKVAWRTVKGMRAFKRNTSFISQYDWALFSGANAPMAVFHRPHGRNIYYCHTIPRFAYDLKTYYLNTVPLWQRPVLRALIRYVKPRYESALKQMDTIIANSENVRNRLWEYLGIEAEVITPACDIDAYSWLGQDDYFLSTARLEPYKRVDLIVKVFLELPEKKLIIASGGSDYENLKKLAKGATNIRFTGWSSKERLTELMGNALATIYIPKNEDFGISPVESIAAGKPVIGVNEGGLRETIIHEQTGVLINPDFTDEEICQAVSEMTAEKALSMRKACEERAQIFHQDIFIEKMRKILYG